MASLEDRTLRGGEAQGQDKEQESWPNHLASSAALDRVWKLRGLWVGGAPVTAWLVPRIRVASLQLHFGTGQGVGPVGPLRPGLEAAEGCWSSRPSCSRVLFVRAGSGLPRGEWVTCHRVGQMGGGCVVWQNSHWMGFLRPTGSPTLACRACGSRGSALSH
ncbi:uncharacterized protein [Alexandromys fortis]|uniref:uncharacterized protein isoform X2 n=1 Tax=Alexandromys fortis TaxID=100897 RepID=UPI0021522E4A|nr:uncharacterized protein LOC126494005 isoform X2 [Microtus fortis]